MTSAPTLPRCSPAHSTPRTPDRPTDGAVVARIAALFGRPLIPWQRAFADVAGELDPATGRPVYSRAVAVVPRRAGKSVLTLAKGLAAGVVGRHRKAFYANHRRETAAAMWRDDWFPWVEDSPLERHIRMYRGNGSEAFVWRSTRSTFRLLPPDPDAMRSLAANVAVIDEARQFTPDQGANVEAAVFPTQATGAGGQTLIVSNAGTTESTWLKRWVDLGRQAVAADRRDGICYVEFAAPEGADPDDEATWWLAHPGLGHHVNLDAVRADHEVMDPDTFGCEWLGWWPETRIDTALVDAFAATTADVAVIDPVVFALEVDEDRTVTDIVAAGADRDGRLVVELVEHRPHGPWVGPRLIELAAEWGPAALVWDAGGPAAALAPEVVDVPTALVGLRTAATAAAAGAFHDQTLARRVWHRDDETLTAAVAAGRRRRAGGAWLYDRRQPGAGPLIAASLALWVHREGSHAPPTVT